MVNGVATDINAVFSLLVSSIRCICMVLIQASISHGSCLKNKKTKVQKVSLVGLMVLVIIKVHYVLGMFLWSYTSVVGFYEQVHNLNEKDSHPFWISD